MSAPKSGLKKFANPMQTFRMERDRSSNGSDRTANKKENSEVQRIKSKYGLKSNPKGVSA
jgi:hypothetical protein